MEEKKTRMTPTDFKEHMSNVLSDEILKEHPLTALHLGIGLVVYVLKQEGYDEGADIFKDAFIKHHDKEGKENSNE